MDTPNDIARQPPSPQGSTGGGSEWLPPLAGGGAAQAEAEAFWCPPPLPEGDPRRADQELCGLGLRLEGGDVHCWYEIQPRAVQVQGGGLGGGQDARGGWQVLGDRPWSDAEVRVLWTMWAVDNGWMTGWDDFMDAYPDWL